MILKSIGRYYRNRLINKGVLGLAKSSIKTFAAVFAIALVLDTAGVILYIPISPILFNNLLNL